MADQKISAMPPGLGAGMHDLVLLVQGGANVQVSKSTFFTAGHGEALQIVGDPGNPVQLLNATGSGTIAITGPGGVLVQFNAAGGQQLVVNDQAGQQYLVIDGPSRNVQIGAPTGSVTIGPPAGPRISITTGPAGVHIIGPNATLDYTPGNAALWVAPLPPDVKTALDRIVARLTSIAPGTPIG